MTHVTLVEVGPRDGLQNEPAPISTDQKIALITHLMDAGLTQVEVGSFVSPDWVPQMADSADVLQGLPRRNGVRFSVLTPNLKGFDAAIRADVDEVAIFAAASEGFAKANLNATIDEAFARFEPVAAAAHAAGIVLRGYISCVIACPYDGPTAPSMVAKLAVRLRALGCHDISLGDTIGAGTPSDVNELLAAVLPHVEATMLSGHFHDTGGRALDNIEASLDFGLRRFDTAIAGLGGCPYAPGAPGNVATEAVHARLTDLGYTTDIDPKKLALAADFARHLTQRTT